MKKIDLHIHSYYSCDGDYSPIDLIKMAFKEGIDYVAITDHNTVKGMPEALAAGEKYGVKIIPGIEIDSSYQKQVLHITGYYLNWRSDKLKYLSKTIKKNQINLVKNIVNNLITLGIKISYDQVEKYSNKYSIPGSATIATAVLKNKNNHKHPLIKPYLKKGDRSDKPVFNLMCDLMYPGKPAYVKKVEYTGVKNIIKIILNLNGIPVLAHPGLYFNPEKEADINKIKNLRDMGLRGLEVFTSYHDRQAAARFLELSRELNLLITAGSDFHGSLKPDIKMGKEVDDDFEILSYFKL